MKSVLSYLLLCAITARVCYSSQDLPVLLWSPERPLNEKTDTFEPVKSVEFHDKFLLPILKSEGESAVAFLQDKLHTDDFTNYADVYSPDSDGGAFKNIKNVMDEHFSLELPKVFSPHLAIEQLKNSFAGDIFVVTSFAEVENLDLGKGKRFLLIYSLNPVTDVPDEEKAMAENDAVIGKVVHHLRKRNVKYTAIFTGQSSGHATADDSMAHKNRHLMQLDAGADVQTNGTFMNASDGNIYVFMYNMSVCYKNDDKKGCGLDFNLFPTIATADDSIQNDTNAKVILTFNKVKPLSNTSYIDYSDATFDVTLSILIQNYGNQWLMNKTLLSVTSSKNITGFKDFSDASLITDVVYNSVPIPYSFHCSQYNLNYDWVREKDQSLKYTFIVMKNFQLQAYNITNNQFFQSEDCVGFFTTAIWMGLVPVGLLIFIMLIGTIMTLNLSTMDRYDDPKGKTISVTVSE